MRRSTTIAASAGRTGLRATLTPLLLAGTAMLALAACDGGGSPAGAPPPPDYMTGMDSIAAAFGKSAEDLESLGKELERLEKRRVPVAPDESEMDDNALKDAFEKLQDRVLDIRDRLTEKAKIHQSLKGKVPSTQDKNKRKVYVEHYDAVGRLLAAILGEGKDEKARTTASMREVMIEVGARGTQDTQKTSADELMNRSFYLFTPSGQDRQLGYLFVLKDYLLLNMNMLEGKKKITVCEFTDLEPLWESKATCVLDNRKLSLVLGSPSDSAYGTYWHKLYKVHEPNVVGLIKQVIGARKRIHEHVSGGAG